MLEETEAGPRGKPSFGKHVSDNDRPPPIDLIYQTTTNPSHLSSVETTPRSGEAQFQLMHLSILREYIELDLALGCEWPLDKERLCDDFIFLTFLVSCLCGSSLFAYPFYETPNSHMTPTYIAASIRLGMISCRTCRHWISGSTPLM